MKGTILIRLVFALTFLVLEVRAAHGAGVIWTNLSGGDWNVAENWEPNVVPGDGDNVLITNNGTYVITVNGTAALAFLGIFGGEGTQTLAIGPNGLSAGNIALGGNGHLEINGPVWTDWLYGSGVLNWQSGVLSGLVQIGGGLNITGDADKYLAAGANLQNYGVVHWSGLGSVKGQDFDFGPGHPVIENTSQGVFEIASDRALQLDNSTYDPSLAFVFVNAGTLRKVAGSGLTLFNNVQFSNSGTVDVQQGTLLFANNNNGNFNSAGLFTVAAGAAVQLSGGLCSFWPGHVAQGDGTFGVVDGAIPVTMMGQLAGRFDWTGGLLLGQWTMASNGVLNISGDSVKYLGAGAALTNYGLVRWSGQGALNGQDFQFSPGHPVLHNQGLFELDNDSILQLDSGTYSPSLAFVFVNSGTLRKVAGNGLTMLNNVQFANSGTVDVQQGTLLFANNNNGNFNSAGLFTVAAGATVQLSGGLCSFWPGHVAQGDGTFGVVDGAIPVTMMGQLTGRFDWTGGLLLGQWTMASNGVLNISGDSVKYLGAGAALTNYGLVRWSGQGALNGQDFQFSPGHPVLHNQGLFELDNDSILQLDSGTYSPSLAFVFVNSGTLRKVAGSGLTLFNNIQFSNSGTVEVQQGTLQFANNNNGNFNSSGLFTVASGCAVQLSGGLCNFLPGHSVQGAGTFGQVDGAIPVTMMGQLAGRFDWTGGLLLGQWTVASNGVLNISGDSVKYLGAGAALTNYGLVRWSGQGAINGQDFQFSPGHPVFANMPGGLFELHNDGVLQLDSGTYSPSLAFVLLNAGTLRKVAGPGMTLIQNVQFSTSGTVDVQQGTLLFAINNNGSFNSSGLFTLAAGAGVQFSGGACSFWPGHVAQGDGTFGVVDGALPVTMMGQLAGRFDWTGGLLLGQWTMATNAMLNISGDSVKYLGAGAALTNYGVVRWTGLGAINGQDFNFGPGHPLIQNLGTFELDNDAVMQLDTWTYDPSLAFVFINAGILSKTAGTGTLFYNLQLANSGTVDVQQGTLQLGGDASFWQESGLVRLAAFGPASYTSVRSSGLAELNGRVQMVLQNGYLPAAGDAFELLTYAATNVAFAAIELPPVSAGLYLAAAADTNHLVVETKAEPVANPDSYTLNENMAADLNVLTNDANLYSGGVVVSSTQPANGTVSINPDSTVHYVPALNYFGPDGFTYQVRNADGRLATGTVNLEVLHVNQQPTLAPIADQALDEQTLLTFTPQATDVDGGPLTFTLGPGAPLGAQMDPSTGVFTWTPSETQGPGVYPITVIVSDNGLPSLSATRTFTATVREVNSAPGLSAIANQSVAETQPLALELTAIDSDLPQNALTFFLVSGPAGLTVSPAGQLSWTPSETQGPSTNLVTVAVKDDGQPSLSATQNFSVVVTEINTAPALLVQTNLVIDELTLLVVTNTATDSDLPANLLSYVLVDPPAGAAIDTNGIITWTPTEAQGPGSNLFVTVVTDNGQPPLSATNSFVVLVNEVNSAPVLPTLADQTVAPIETLSLACSALDLDVPANTLSYSLDSAPAGASITADGAFTWAPTFDQAGSTNAVVVRVTDSGVPPLSSSQAFSIVVLNTGLRGDYFAGTNFETLVLSRDDAQVNFEWAAGSPAPGMPTNKFSARWTGQVIARYSQTYTFYTVSDDGVRLWVDGKPLIDNWTVHTATTNTGTIALNAGQAYMLRLEYFDATSNAVARLMWSSTNQVKEIVPSSQLLCVGYSDIISNAIYRFTPRLATGRSMEVANGGTADRSQVDIRDWKANAYQKWQAVGVGSNYFKLIPQHALTKVLELNGGYTTNGTRVQIATDNGTARQQVQFLNMGQGWFKIQPQPAPGSVLDLKGGNSGNGTAVQLNQDLNTNPQLWRLDRQ